MEALSQVDEKILTESTKTMIKEAFEKAVDEKTKAKVQEQLDSITESTETFAKQIVESHVIDLKEKFEKASEVKAKELAEAYGDALKTQIEEKYEDEFKGIQENLSLYVKYVTKKFIEENKANWEDEVAVAKANSIMESASEFAAKFGIELSKITSTDETKEALDESVSENAKLRDEISDLKRAKYIAESCKGMTVASIEKVEQLMEGVSVADEKTFKDRVELIKSTLVTEKAEEPKPDKKGADKKRSWES
jgi:Asp/Glu/hydantoin racemase